MHQISSTTAVFHFAPRGMVRKILPWLLATISAGALAAQPVLDQHNDDYAQFGGSSASVANDRTQVQTFTVGKSGNLAVVEVDIKKGPATSESLLLSIWSTNLSGLPSTQLASQSFDAQLVSSMLNFFAWDLGNQAFAVSSGELLAIVVNSNATNFPPFFERYEWAFSGGDFYVGGEFYTQLGSSYTAIPLDLRFRTYIAAVPEPPAAAWLLLGLCALALLSSGMRRT